MAGSKYHEGSAKWQETAESDWAAEAKARKARDAAIKANMTSSMIRLDASSNNPRDEIPAKKTKVKPSNPKAPF